MAKNTNKEPTNKSVWSKDYYGPIEYEMPKELAKQILATRKGEEKNFILHGTRQLNNRS